MEHIKLISLNFWNGNLIQKSIEWLKSEIVNDCIIALQEVEEKDIPTLEAELGMRGWYGPMHHYSPHPPDNRLSVAVFSDIPRHRQFRYVYGGFNLTRPHDWWRTGKPLYSVLAGASYGRNGNVVRIATTHFTWTGLPLTNHDPEQHESASGLIQVLRDRQVDVFTCDLNAPRTMPDGRPGVIWHRLSDQMVDNVPADVVTTLDPIHKASKDGDNLVVDGIFSAPTVTVKNVRVHIGVSDHCGLTAELLLKPKGRPG